MNRLSDSKRIGKWGFWEKMLSSRERGKSDTKREF